MARAVITYDKDLPEIPDRDSSLPPTAYLRKKAGVSDEYEIVDERRPSKMLLVNSLRTAVGKWRSDGYPGASVVTRRLFQFWFDEDHIVMVRHQAGDLWTVQPSPPARGMSLSGPRLKLYGGWSVVHAVGLIRCSAIRRNSHATRNNGLNADRGHGLGVL